MKQIKRLQKLYNALELCTRENGSKFYALTDNKRDKYQDIIFECHFDAMPNDYAYNAIESVLSQLLEHVEYDDVDDFYPETDPYTHNLVKIIDKYSEYMDRALEEVQPSTWWDLLVAANDLFYNDVLQTLLAWSE
jgi:hypothetical protein